MSLNTLVLSLVAMLTGALIAAQAPINAAAGARLGHPLGAATLSFVVGTLALVAVTLLAARDQVTVANVATLPPLLFLGGLLGACYVTTAIVLTPLLGVGAVVALGIAGQVLASLLLDHYGLLGLVERELTAGRALGAALVVAGALMVRYL